MLVGECFTSEEETAGEAFLGRAGEDLNKMLFEAGLNRNDCYLTNIVNSRPPRDDVSSYVSYKKNTITPAHRPFRNLYCTSPIHQGYLRLRKEIELVKPKIIIAFGNLAMWALTGASGIVKWRGSRLQEITLDGVRTGIVVIPTLPPYMVTFIHENRAMVVSDLRRVKELSMKNPPYAIPGDDWDFTIRPSFVKALGILRALTKRLDDGIPLWIDFDLETRAGHIACAGISWTKRDALCIPLMCVENYNGYWPLEEEASITFALYKLLTHKNVRVRGQNLLYDCQYTYRHWHFIPRVAQDTMISHHTCFAGLPKSLAFQASLYCKDYLYWKDDGKTWTKNVSEDQLWAYNAVDCVRTRECGEVELENIKSLGLADVEAFQQRLFWPVLSAMQRGVRINLSARRKLSKELELEMQNCENFLTSTLGHTLNPRSSLQMCSLFYEDLKNQKIFTRAKKGSPSHLTCDDDALQLIGKRNPVMLPLIKAINEYRTLGVFLSTFVAAKLDIDSRMRCSYNICGTETYRFNSSKNAFDCGTNLQNVPKGDDHDDPNRLSLPNIRKLFIPDEGFTFFDMDLDRADLQVVVWEAGEAELKEALRKGVDMHLLNAFALLGKEVALDDLIEGTESCIRFKSDYKKERQLAKAFIHGTNYGGGARTMAIAAGVTVHQAEKFQKLYFGKYPGIKQWHERVEQQLASKHYVENILGYRRFYFEKTDGLLPEALAWIPQSTVACVINRAWVNIYENIPEVQVLLQVHDSLAGQFPSEMSEICIQKMTEQSQILLPYSDPLIIPIGIKTSPISWGHC
jgi:DNA polymerase-1